MEAQQPKYKVKVPPSKSPLENIERQPYERIIAQNSEISQENELNRRPEHEKLNESREISPKIINKNESELENEEEQKSQKEDESEPEQKNESENEAQSKDENNSHDERNEEKSQNMQDSSEIKESKITENNDEKTKSELKSPSQPSLPPKKKKSICRNFKRIMRSFGFLTFFFMVIFLLWCYYYPHRRQQVSESLSNIYLGLFEDGEGLFYHCMNTLKNEFYDQTQISNNTQKEDNNINNNTQNNGSKQQKNKTTNTTNNNDTLTQKHDDGCQNKETNDKEQKVKFEEENVSNDGKDEENSLKSKENDNNHQRKDDNALIFQNNSMNNESEKNQTYEKNTSQKETATKSESKEEENDSKKTSQEANETNKKINNKEGNLKEEENHSKIQSTEINETNQGINKKNQTPKDNQKIENLKENPRKAIENNVYDTDGENNLSLTQKLSKFWKNLNLLEIATLQKKELQPILNDFFLIDSNLTHNLSFLNEDLDLFRDYLDISVKIDSMKFEKNDKKIILILMGSQFEAFDLMLKNYGEFKMLSGNLKHKNYLPLIFLEKKTNSKLIMVPLFSKEENKFRLIHLVNDMINDWTIGKIQTLIVIEPWMVSNAENLNNFLVKVENFWYNQNFKNTSVSLIVHKNGKELASILNEMQSCIIKSWNGMIWSYFQIPTNVNLYANFEDIFFQKLKLKQNK